MIFRDVYLVGCPDDRKRHVLDALEQLAMPASATFNSVADARHAIGRDEKYFLLVCFLMRAGDLDELTQLNREFPKQPVVALSEDAEVLIRAMHRGAAQVVAVPIVPEDFRAAVACLAKQRDFAQAKSYVFIVSGVNGGCGATTLTLNFVYEVSLLLQQPTIMAELSPHLGSLAVYLDIKPEYTTHDLFHSRMPVDRHMVERTLANYGDHMRVLVDEYRSFSPLRVNSSDLARLINILRTISPAVFLDIPCMCADFYFEMLAGADGVVLVAEQTLPSLRALRFVAESLGKIDGIGRIITLLNRYDPNKQDFRLEDLKSTLGLERVLTLADDPVNVRAAIEAGRPMRLQNPQSPFLADISAAAREFVGMLTGESVAPQPASSNFLEWLAQVFYLRR